MKRRLEISELIFKIISYLFLGIFAILCLYPLVYAVSSAISEMSYVYGLEGKRVILLPKGNLQFEAFKEIIVGSAYSNRFWNSYTNTLFLTVFGTVWALGVSLIGAYALSKKRLLFRKGFNFFLVFTMWFAAGIVPQKRNYESTQNLFNSIGITDNKWLIVIAMGMAAMNIILLRNAFEGVPSEIEEAARIDGATEWQILTKVYIPMCKSTVATVTLFFAISRWNGYFWADQFLKTNEEKPLQVFIHDMLVFVQDSEQTAGWNEQYIFATDSFIYALVVCSVIPILIIYPFIQKYFAKGVNMGGVKE